MKVDLLQEPWGAETRSYKNRPTPIKRSLPWYTTRYRRHGRVQYVHRVRSGLLHPGPSWRSKTSARSVSFSLWCGQGGSLWHGYLLDTIPAGAAICATCEARALGAGLSRPYSLPKTCCVHTEAVIVMRGA